jgi:hypothetical protein
MINTKVTNSENIKICANVDANYSPTFFDVTGILLLPPGGSVMLNPLVLFHWKTTVSFGRGREVNRVCCDLRIAILWRAATEVTRSNTVWGT